MRAALITAHGRAPELGQRHAPAPEAGEVLVEVAATPLTPLDLLCATGTSYFGPRTLPYVPGVQGVGVARSGALEGSRVWFASSAGMVDGDGGFAELACVPERDVVLLPHGVDEGLAAALGLSAVAAWEMLFSRAGLQPGETVLVLGAGGAVGQVAVQAARLLGAARVVAAARSPQARETATRLGADEVVDLADDDEVAGLASRLSAALPDGADVVIDPLAGVAGSAGVRVLAEGGRLVNLGSSAAPTLEVDSATLRSRSASVLGYTNNALSTAAREVALTTVLQHAAAGRLTLEHDQVRPEELPEAWREVADGVRRRRVVVRW
jgi:NADPH:quinone reductase-like Zn-dependent oxidoreductase